MAAHRPVPERLLQRVQACDLEGPQRVDAVGLMGVQGLLHHPMHGAPVRVPELVGELLVRVALGGEFDGAGLAPLGQRRVVPTPARRTGR